MARCVPLPSPIPRCHICCAKGAANSVSASAATTPGGVGALAGISAGHFVLRFDGGIHPLWWYAAGPGLSGVGAGPGPRFWRVRIAGRGCHPGRHPYAVGQALYGPFAARSVSEKFCQLGHCVQPRQLSLLVKRLLRFCRSQRP